MSFDIVYKENGDIVAEFDTREDAVRALARIAEEQPELIGGLGLLPVAEDGDPAGDFVPAAHFLTTA